MNPFAFSISIYLTVVFGDRLRQISWHTAKPLFVALYLSHMLWALSLLYEVYREAFGLQESAGALAMLILIRITRCNWADGVPASMLRDRSHLRQPDL